MDDFKPSASHTRLDDVLKGAQFRASVSVPVHADAPALFRALGEVTLRDMPLAWALGELRYLPRRILGHPRPRAEASAQPFIAQLLEEGSVMLALVPNREIVFGGAGKYHQIIDQQPQALHTAQEFREFDDPSYQKLAISVRVEERAGRRRLVLEHRTRALSADSRRAFARYWVVIRAAGNFVSWLLLRAVRRRAEASDSAAQRGASALTRSAILMLTSVIGLLAFAGIVRPWFLRWGATDAEVIRRLPGDEIVPSARTRETRAITIDAPRDAVWPWIAQLGQDRGGFYSFAILEDLVGCEMPYAQRIHPEFQHWQAGDKLWMYPPGKLNGTGHAQLASLDVGHALGFATRIPGTGLDRPYDGSWTFVLEPIDAHTTRLLIRGRALPEQTWLAAAFDRLVFDPMHFVMERRMMANLKRWAEGGHVAYLVDSVEPLLWTIVAGFGVASAVQVLRRRRWLRPWLGFVSAAVLFELLSLAQPPLWLGIPLVLALGLLVCVRERRELRPASLSQSDLARA